MSVIPFKRPEQTMEGEAFCLQCRKEWIATAPIGTVELECPYCETMKGLFKFQCCPTGLVRVCNCGNDLFYLTPEGHLCANCGIYQRY